MDTYELMSRVKQLGKMANFKENVANFQESVLKFKNIEEIIDSLQLLGGFTSGKKLKDMKIDSKEANKMMDNVLESVWEGSPHPLPDKNITDIVKDISINKSNNLMNPLALTLLSQGIKGIARRFLHKGKYPEIAGKDDVSAYGYKFGKEASKLESDTRESLMTSMRDADVGSSLATYLLGGGNISNLKQVFDEMQPVAKSNVSKFANFLSDTESQANQKIGGFGLDLLWPNFNEQYNLLDNKNNMSRRKF